MGLIRLLAVNIVLGAGIDLRCRHVIPLDGRREVPLNIVAAAILAGFIAFIEVSLDGRNAALCLFQSGSQSSNSQCSLTSIRASEACTM